MITITQQELDKKIAEHEDWVLQSTGRRLELSFVKIDGLTISGNLDDAIFEGCEFVRCILNCGSFSDAEFTECAFDRCEFMWADLSGSSFTDCSFIMCRMPYANTSGTMFLRCDLSDGGLPEGRSFIDSKLSKVDFLSLALELLQMQVDDDEVSNTKVALSKVLKAHIREVD